MRRRSIMHRRMIVVTVLLVQATATGTCFHLEKTGHNQWFAFESVKKCLEEV